MGDAEVGEGEEGGGFVAEGGGGAEGGGLAKGVEAVEALAGLVFNCVS